MKSYWKIVKIFRLKLRTFKNIELNALPVYDDRCKSVVHQSIEH